MAELQICLLGPFQVCWDFVPVGSHVWHNPWAARLLKLVLLNRPEPLSVTEANALLGGGLPRSTLMGALEQIRRVLEPGATVSLDQSEHIQFEPSPHCWVDLDTFREHYEAGIRAASRGDMLPAIMAFQEADGLYQGDLLEESHEPWVLPHRQRLQATYTDILERLAEGHAVLARYQDAVGFCYKALAHDPLREMAYQRMMVYYYYLGDLPGTESAYAACREALESAGRKVSAETDDLWTRLSRSEVPQSPAASAAPAKHESGNSDA